MNQALSAILPPEALQSMGSGPLYLKLRQTLEEAIHSGRLAHGDALPAERDLADYANVSRVTVRKAVDDLVKDGLLARRQGSGTFVKASLGSAAPEALDPLRETLAGWVAEARSAGLEDEDIFALVREVLSGGAQ